MIKSVFVPLQGLARDVQALETAFNLARLFEAHVDCLHVRPDPRLLIASTTAGMETGLGVGVFPAELWQTLVEADQRRARAAHDTFTKFCQTHAFAPPRDQSAGKASAGFREIEGDVASEITANARYSDLAVLAHDSLLADTTWDAIGDVIIGCGRPVLLAPDKRAVSALSTVAVAWKNSAESARAVTAAMPILAKASHVIVLAAREGREKVHDALRSAERLAELLRRHRIPARAEHVPAEPHDPPQAVMERVLGLNCDLLVMGAYGHSRTREFVFGGFTRHVLNQTKLPVLVAH